MVEGNAKNVRGNKLLFCQLQDGRRRRSRRTHHRRCLKKIATNGHRAVRYDREYEQQVSQNQVLISHGIHAALHLPATRRGALINIGIGCQNIIGFLFSYYLKIELAIFHKKGEGYLYACFILFNDPKSSTYVAEICLELSN